MPSNVRVGPDADIGFLLDRLKTSSAKDKFTTKTSIIEGVNIAFDTDTTVEGSYASEPGRMLSLSLQVNDERAPKWQTLHFSLGGCNLTEAAILGVVIRSSAPRAVHTRICLRSGQGSKFVDSYFEKTMMSYKDESTHLDVMQLARHPDVPKTAPWRDLVFFFPTRSLNLDLLDMRVFII